jgi:hypothetical protein
MRKLRNRRAFWSAIAATAFLIAGAVVAAQLSTAKGSAAKLRVTKELREPS